MFTNMSTLTVLQYTPKVPHSITHKLPAKPCWTDSSKKPVKTLLVSTKATESNDKQEKPARDSKHTARQSPTFDTDKDQGMC
jgi:hypothetical protein